VVLDVPRLSITEFDEYRLDSLDHRRHPREMEILAQHIQQGYPAVDAYRVRHAVDGQAT
jgi:hypothetical protein